jgi:acetyl esterase/lipase
MITSRLLGACLLMVCLGGVLAGGARKRDVSHPPRINGAREEAYKTVEDVVLNVWVMEPPGERGTARPAVIFFFGGGWNGGTPTQFESQARHFANRGMVTVLADYRVKSRHGVKPIQCVADAKSCVRWVRSNAGRLGIDPDRIVAAGGSAGGHLAAATATLPGLEEPGEDVEVSSVPNALILFNPALVLAPYGEATLEGFGTRVGRERLGAEPEALSPIHHLRKGTPPTIIFHGTADSTVPYVTVEMFEKAMVEQGNRCRLIGYEGQPHGFFNPGRSGGKYCRETLAEADRFLVSLGYLSEE